MSRKKQVILLTVMLIISFGFNVFALGVKKVQPGQEIPSDDIFMEKTLNGEFKRMSYVITDTGATSGIRYRTTDITFELNGMKGTLKATELINYKPAPGEKVTSIVSIDTNDLITKVFVKERPEKVKEALKNPENLKIGANIEIYNAKTNEVYTTITDEDYRNNTIYKKIKKYGFHLGHADNMESRWHGHQQKKIYNPDYVIEDPLEENEISSPKSGLRPTIFVLPDSWEEYKTADDTYDGNNKGIDYNGNGYNDEY